MASKNINTRIIHKHDTEENWSKASFIPKQGELIIYDKDDTHNIERFKIGDGTTNVNDLPFQNINISNSKSGSVIQIDDVSPVTHEMSVKISSDTVTDLTAVKVSKYGKNFIDINSIANDIVKKNPTTCEITDFDGKRCLKLGTTSTISYTVQTLIPLYKLQLKVYNTNYSKGFMSYTKNDTGTTRLYINALKTNEWESIARWHSSDSQYFTGIQFYKEDASAPVYIDLDSVMLGTSRAVTEYEPYKGAEYTPSADGTVNGVTSLYPNTTLITDTDGVIIDCEYLTKNYKYVLDNRIPKQTQSDWQQNDETANDYIKNRPGGYEGSPENVLSETTFSGTSATLDMALVLGYTYIVTFDGIEYVSTAKRDGAYPIFIGNTTYAWHGTITDDPFCILGNTNPCTINCDPGDHTVKVDKINIVKIPEKYLDIKNTNIVNGSAKGSLRTVGSTQENTSYKIGDYAFAEGSVTQASGHYSHTEGESTTASGDSSHAEGAGTTASGEASHAEGESTKASGHAAHAEGRETQASGNFSHAEGNYTKASGNFSHAEGNNTVALGYVSHAEGDSTVAGQMGFKVTACEKLTNTTGTYTLTSITGLEVNQYYSVYLMFSKENCGKITAIDSTNKKITVDGYPDIRLSPSSSSTANHLTIVNRPDLGDIKISGDYSHAEGYNTKALGNYSHTEGGGTTASAPNSHAEGNNTVASRESSHAEGSDTTASGFRSHAEGDNTTASGESSHAEGSETQATAEYSHAEGSGTKALGDTSHAEGFRTTASSNYQHVQGKYNIEDSNNIYADIIGNGSSDTERSNAHTLDWNGNAWYAGDVYVGSTSGKNKDDGSKKLATEEYVNSTISSSIVVDSELSDTSENPVQNKVIKAYINSITISDIDSIRNNAINGQTAYEMLSGVETLLSNI